MKYFYLVRHGEKQTKQGDPPLSPAGKRQAKLTAKYLSQFPVKAVFSSPMKRTTQTAAEIGKILGIPVLQTPLLRERVNWGDDPTQSFTDFLSMWQRSSANRDWQPPVGDSSLQAGKRLKSLLDSLISHTAEHIVLVTHGGIITDFLRNLFDESYLNNHIPNFSSTLDENIKDCSITILEHHGQVRGTTTDGVGANTPHHSDSIGTGAWVEEDGLNNSLKLIKLAFWEHLKEP